MPSRFGRYSIERLLGRGGMGAVYLARQDGLDRPVVVKVMAAETAKDPVGVARLRREAKAAAQVSSENVVRVFESGQEGGVPYIAMEFVEGTTAQALVAERGPLPYAEATRIVLQAAAGLADVHAAGILHRDVKPANILIGKDGSVKLADFGICKLARAQALGKSVTLSVAGEVLGSPDYMSPEQAEERPLDARADLYSLGVTYYFLLTGALPFHAPTALATLARAIREDPKPPRALVPAIPEAVESACVALMAKAPEDRPANAKQAIRLLSGLEAAKSAPARPRALQGAAILLAGLLAGVVAAVVNGSRHEAKAAEPGRVEPAREERRPEPPREEPQREEPRPEAAAATTAPRAAFDEHSARLDVLRALADRSPAGIKRARERLTNGGGPANERLLTNLALLERSLETLLQDAGSVPREPCDLFGSVLAKDRLIGVHLAATALAAYEGMPLPEALRSAEASELIEWLGLPAPPSIQNHAFAYYCTHRQPFAERDARSLHALEHAPPPFGPDAAGETRFLDALAAARHDAIEALSEADATRLGEIVKALPSADDAPEPIRRDVRATWKQLDRIASLVGELLRRLGGNDGHRLLSDLREKDKEALADPETCAAILLVRAARMATHKAVMDTVAQKIFAHGRATAEPLAKLLEIPLPDPKKFK